MRLTLEHIKAHPEKRERFSLVHIWSAQHGMWWATDGAGYASDQRHAGTFTMQDAWARTSHCGPEKRIVYVSMNQDQRPTKAVPTVAEIAQEYGNAYRAAQATHAALAKYWADAFPSGDEGQRHPKAHKFGACEEQTAPYGDRDPLTRCDICCASEPLWQARAAARKARGIALRRLLSITRAKP